MWDCDCGAVPVRESNGASLVGIVTDRDICMATWSRALAPNAILVSQVMSHGVVSCGPRDSITRAESIMRENQIRRLPVVDDGGRIVGILSLADIARATNPSKPTSDLSSEQLAETLAGISRASASLSAREQPRSVA
jgi:signal-transduction protein with cAMP-binding, CBS, and nucleotidyltransferase domain